MFDNLATLLFSVDETKNVKEEPSTIEEGVPTNIGVKIPTADEDQAGKMFRKDDLELSHTFRFYFSFENSDGRLRPLSFQE